MQAYKIRIKWHVKREFPHVAIAGTFYLILKAAMNNSYYLLEFYFSKTNTIIYEFSMQKRLKKISQIEQKIMIITK